MLVIAGVVGTVIAINAIYPAIVRSSNSVSTISQKLDQRIETQITIIQATSEEDNTGEWQDGDGDGYFDVTIWVKNVGSSIIGEIETLDVFLGKSGMLARIPYTIDAGASYPQWSYTLENGTEWKSTVTLKISVHYAGEQDSGTYQAKIVAPSGAYGEQFFSF